MKTEEEHMRQIALLLSITLVTMCVAVVEMGAQGNSAPIFNAKILSASRSTVQFDLNGGSAAGGSMFLACSTAALTVERNFKYFRMENQRTESRGKGSFEVEFFQSPPAGVDVVQAGSSPPTNTAGGPEKAVFDAVSWGTACKQLGFGRDSAK